MRKLKNRILALICLLMVTSNYAKASAFTDDYPKNPKIDAINYAFKIELSDETDEIVCDVTIDIRFLGAGETASKQALGAVGPTRLAICFINGSATEAQSAF